MSANFISCLLFYTLHLIILYIVYTILQTGDGGDVIEHQANLTDIVVLASYHVCYFAFCVCSFTHCVSHFTHCVAILQAGDGGDIKEHPANLTDIAMLYFIIHIMFAILRIV